jgi:hypothetical protein
MKKRSFGVGAVLGAFLTAFAAGAATPVVTTISGQSPFAGCLRGGSDGLFAEAEVEPSLAVDPARRRYIVAAFQQDRFSTGAARGLVSAASSDGGRSWTRVSLPFSACVEGTTTNWPRASDPWVSIGADGRAYAIGLGRGIAVSSSGDHGRRWSTPTMLAANSPGFLTDKPAITADPDRPATAYAVWQRYLTRPDGPPIESDTMLRVTRDGGRTWGGARVVLRHSPDAGDVSSVILVDPARRRLFHLAYWQAGGVPGPGIEHLSQLLVQRSSDGGRTWSRPRRIAAFRWLAGQLRDPASGKIIRPGLPSFAIDGGTGALYAVWQDARFSGRTDQIAFAASTNGGVTWTRPRRVDTGDTGLVPVVAADRGVVAVTYYRVGPDGTRLVLAGSTDSGRTFRRRPLGPSFTLADAPLLAGDSSILVPPGLFLGDYSGLVVEGGSAYAAFATANPDAANPTDIRFAVSSVR